MNLKGIVSGVVCEKCGAVKLFPFSTKGQTKIKARSLGWTISKQKQVGTEWRSVCKCPDCVNKRLRKAPSVSHKSTLGGFLNFILLMFPCVDDLNGL